MLGAAQAGRRSSLRLVGLLAEEDLVARPGEEATAVVPPIRTWPAIPALRAAIDELMGAQAEYLDKT